MKFRKRRFAYEEKYAVWRCNGSRCWYCTEPLLLWETTVDHVLPEWLLYDDTARARILSEYGLRQDFDINSYANWLPCHDRCNREKGARPLEFVPGHRVILERLIKRASHAERLARSVCMDVEKGKVFSVIFSALEKRKISMIDIRDVLGSFIEKPEQKGLPSERVILDSGYWFRRDEIKAEGLCQCERNTCVGHDHKVYCYFPENLSQWVIKTGLFWQCYDEVIRCPRCAKQHKRGHVGRDGSCERPYLNQQDQHD